MLHFRSCGIAPHGQSDPCDRREDYKAKAQEYEERLQQLQAQLQEQAVAACAESVPSEASTPKSSLAPSRQPSPRQLSRHTSQPSLPAAQQSASPSDPAPVSAAADAHEDAHAAERHTTDDQQQQALSRGSSFSQQALASPMEGCPTRPVPAYPPGPAQQQRLSPLHSMKKMPSWQAPDCPATGADTIRAGSYAQPQPVWVASPMASGNAPYGGEAASHSIALQPAARPAAEPDPVQHMYAAPYDASHNGTAWATPAGENRDSYASLYTKSNLSAA